VPWFDGSCRIGVEELIRLDTAAASMSQDPAERRHCGEGSTSFLGTDIVAERDGHATISHKVRWPQLLRAQENGDGFVEVDNYHP
jgi:hypothetical protein